MNFDHTREERDFIQTLETTLAQSAEEHPKLLITQLAETGYPTLGPKVLAGALPGTQERLAQWKPGAYRTMEYGLRIAAPAIARFGPDAWQETWLPLLHRGDLLATAAIDTAEGEPDLSGKAHESGIFIAGAKTGSPGAETADLILASGTVEASPALFLIEKETADITLTRGATGLFTLKAQGAFLPDTHVAILETQTPLDAFLQLHKNRVQISEATGHAAALFEQAKKAAKTRPEGGKPPIARQEIGFKLATMYTLLQTSRLMSANASSLIDTDDSDAPMASRCARVFCSEAACEIAASALDVMGEKGFDKNGPADRIHTVQALRVETTSVGRTKEAIGDMLLKY